MTAMKPPPGSPGTNATVDDPRSVAATPRTRQVLLATTDGVCEAWVNAQAAATGWVMDTSSSAEDAVRRVLNGRYSTVLLDDTLGGADAARATRLIRAWEGRRRRTVIVGLLDPTAGAAGEELLAAGVDECLRRLLDTSRLWETLQRRAAGAPPSGCTAGGHGAELDPNVPRSPRLSHLFLEQIPAALAELAKALEQQEPGRIGAVAHKLKGSCIALGAWVMASLASELQAAAERGELARVPPHLEALRDHFDGAAAELRQELPGAAPSPPLAPPLDPDGALAGAVDGRSERD